MAENAEENARPVPKEAQSETLVEDTCALEQETTTEEPTTRELPARPIKRARTAYFVFADDKWAEIAAQVSLIFSEKEGWTMLLLSLSHAFTLLIA
jgi:hypothetical protein